GALDAGCYSGDDRLLRALVQTLPTPLDRAQELVEVDLERREDRVGPILHLEPRLASLAPRVVDDVGGLALGQLDDLGLGRFPDGLLASLAQNAVALALCLGEHLLALLDDPAGLLDLLGNRRPHLVEDVVDLLAVDPDLVGQRDGLRVVDEVVQLVDQDKYIHRFSESTEAFGLRLERPEAALDGLRLWLRLGLRLLRRLPGLVRAENPAAAARAKRLEQLLRVALRQDHLVTVAKLRLQPVGGLARRPAGAQLLQHLVCVALAEPHVVPGSEHRFQPLAHSWGFSGVPGRPSGNISVNLRATASGTSSSTFPPKAAISFTPLEETKLTCGLAIT